MSLLDNKLLRCFLKCYPMAEKVFVPFDRYCAATKCSDASVAAKQRVDDVWAMWEVCGPTAPVGTAQLVGYYIDLHIPLLTRSPRVTQIHQIYQLKLAPEQNATFPVTYKLPFCAPNGTETDLDTMVGNLWVVPPPKMNASWTPAMKLLRKGMPDTKTVRYIQPQAARCLHAANSRDLLCFISKLHSLGGYRHTTHLATPAARIALYQQPPDVLIRTIVSKLASDVYKVLAESISAVLVCNVTLMIEAERVSRDLAAYIRKYGNTTQQSCINATPRMCSLRAIVPKNTLMQTPVGSIDARTMPAPPKLHQVPLDPDISRIQLIQVRKMTGLSTISAYWCGMCAVLHVRPPVLQLPRTSKRKMGVSVDLSTDSLIPTCNQCELRSFLRIVELTGHLTTAYLSSCQKSPVKIVICGKCANICTDARYIRLLPLCATCYQKTMMATIAGIKCVCGQSAAMKKGSTFTALDSDGRATIYAPCFHHIHTLPVITTHPLTPAVEYLDVARFATKYTE